LNKTKGCLIANFATVPFLVSHIMISVKHTEAGERRRLCWFLLHLEGIAHGVSGCFFDHFHKNANLQT
ncbi:hypothetical protein, partial [Klebsiella pneumoniae]|uniref:hypothetical protein n=1 Tax=Klebsiella pneumoniae TaxID=573 RepID=UPI001C628D0B